VLLVQVDELNLNIGSSEVTNVTDSSAGTRVPVLSYIASIPRFGDLVQVGTAGSQEYNGKSVLEAFYSTAAPTPQFASQVLAVSASRPAHPASACLGVPDVLRAGSDARAWSPQPTTDGSPIFITVAFANASFVKSVTLFISNGMCIVVASHQTSQLARS
jgi:hypothetical protein